MPRTREGFDGENAISSAAYKPSPSENSHQNLQLKDAKGNDHTAKKMIGEYLST
ncbi:GM23207 [Drosophila sechellia]|uniref:GM23207 n=1 Tax=Drosophila sechellia TaxID=7238 RepID=B4IIF1_DROSE|nr:GM23207 [Drosophila sechellia]